MHCLLYTREPSHAFVNVGRFDLFACLGWEHHFNLTEGYMILESDTLHWTVTHLVFGLLAEVLIVSKKKAIIRLDAGTETNALIARANMPFTGYVEGRAPTATRTTRPGD